MKQLIYVGPGMGNSESDFKRIILRRLGEEMGFDVFMPTHHETTSQLLLYFKQADSFIADLSHERPSVYFELGLAAASGAPIELIAASGTVLHQIPREHIVTFYSDMKEFELQVKGILLTRFPKSPLTPTTQDPPGDLFQTSSRVRN